MYRRQGTDLTQVDAIQVLDEGPLVARVLVTRSFRSSTIAQVYELRAGASRLDIHTDIDWHEHDHVLKAAFPLDLQTDELTREIQFGHLTTKIHTNTSWDAARFEVCAHRWVVAAEPDFGVALLNDAKYGYDASRTRAADDDRPTTSLRLTLLKGAQYPDPHADEGRHTFTYSLLPTRDGVAEAIAEGYRLNLPVRAVRGSGAANTAPEPPLVAAEGASVLVETVKPADDDSGDLIVRVVRVPGRPLAARAAVRHGSHVGGGRRPPRGTERPHPLRGADRRRQPGHGRAPSLPARHPPRARALTRRVSADPRVAGHPDVTAAADAWASSDPGGRPMPERRDGRAAPSVRRRRPSGRAAS